MGLIELTRPYDRIYLAASWQHWARDLGFEWPIPTHDWAVLEGGSSVELFVIPPPLRYGLYSARPKWYEHVECCNILFVSTPPILAYYKNVVIVDHTRATVPWPVGALEVFYHGTFVLSLRCMAQCDGAQQ